MVPVSRSYRRAATHDRKITKARCSRTSGPRAVVSNPLNFIRHPD
jgi:hypothetical protein